MKSNMKQISRSLTLDEAKKMYAEENPIVTAILLTMFSREELTSPTLPNTWNEIGLISGWELVKEKVVSVPSTQDRSSEFDHNKHIFAYKYQAESALAMSQLSQLLLIYNRGWVPSWNDKITKWCIECAYGELEIYTTTFTTKFLCFKDEQTARIFLSKFEDLIRIYYSY